MISVCEHDSIPIGLAAVSKIDGNITGSVPSANLHVLTLTPFYPTAGDGATGCFIAEPIPWLSEAGIKSTVIAVRPIYRGRASMNADVHPATWMHYLPLPRGFGLASSGSLLFAHIRSVVRQLHAREPLSLIHAHAALPCGHAALLLSRELHIPYVVSVHGRDAFSLCQVGGVAGEWCRRASERVYDCAHRVICISEKVREEVTAGANCQSSVVYNGVDTDMFCPGPLNDSGELIVLSIGNLTSTKGHEVLLRSLARIRASYPTVRAQIIGDGPEYVPLRHIARDLGIADQVEFLGRQSRQTVADALRRCTVFALPSSYEGLGCVYLEAMATAKPTIGCLGQGIAEIIQTGKNGWLVEPDNPQALAEALHVLLSDPDLQFRLGTVARRTAAGRFTLAHQAAQMARIYQECAS